ncbi:S-Ena type endospore appendage [Neobacillus niacini]|uniref:S-Ena type endospore appendage n=1 Tax=Neobacillus niacini TaxID=86668 RepID=UPI0005ED9D78|nr:S-Ena type endospore appendage [Neobacillus niacini]
MCNSGNGNCCCCPQAQIITEEICGIFDARNNLYWAGPVDDYFQGTFEISVTTGIAQIAVFTQNGFVFSPAVNDGDSTSISANNFPSSFFILFGDAGTIGRYCITLYKRVLV